LGQRHARQFTKAQTLSEDYEQTVRDLVANLIPLAKKRVAISLDRSREDVEDELATLAHLFIIEDHLRK
jgi:hypothetical protein